MVTSVVTTPNPPGRPEEPAGQAGWVTPGRVRTLVAVALRAPLSGRTWREVGYWLISTPVSVAGFALVLAALVAGTALTVTVVGAVLGLLLLLSGLGLATGVAGVQRRLAQRMLGLRVPAPPPEPPAGRGVLPRLDSALRRTRRWRAVCYVLIRCPLAYAGTVAIAVSWATGLLYLSYPALWAILYRRNEHLRPASKPVPILSPFPAGGLHISNIGEAFLVFLLAVPVLVAAAWVTRGAVAIDSWLLRHLLSPVSLTARVKELERSRALAVDDAEARLRRVERDLHDGAQARLVAIAMTLGMAKEKLDASPDDGPPEDAAVRALVDAAHANAKEAIAEVRDLARGIHPPVLDNGLPDALATLAAQSAVPVAIAADIDSRPTPAIEAIAYFCAAELIANVAKHSGASSASLEAAAGDGILRLRVWDNGKGGAAAGPGSGLAGLAERVGTVDGSLHIDSPAGGPTAVRVELPLHA